MGKKDINKDDIHPSDLKMKEVSISTKSFRFLQQFCPESISSCLKETHHTPRSKFIRLTLYKKHCSCIMKLSDDLSLLDGVSHEIARDIKKIIKN